jgi:hypothetical protein
MEMLTGIPQLDAFRALVRTEIEKELKRDGYCKRFEGAVSYAVRMPPVVDWSDMPDPMGRQPEMAVEHQVDLYCYVIGPSRTYRWVGATIDEVFASATADFTKWAADAEAEHAS